MLLYAIILIVLGGGVAGWLGYKAISENETLKARMNSRNQWLKMQTAARQTDEETRASANPNADA